MEAQTSHRKRIIASLAVTFLGIVALGVAGVSTFAGAGNGLDIEPAGANCVKVDMEEFSGTLTNVDYGITSPSFSISVFSNGTTAGYTLLSPTDGSVIVSQVIVKGGSDQNGGGDEVYSAPGDHNGLSGSGFTAPLNPNTPAEDDTFGVSHVTYCVSFPQVGDDDDDDDTTTTTEQATTTTEQATTTTAAVGGIVEETTTTEAEVEGVVVEPETPQAAPDELAFTGVGDGTALFAALGVVLISFGIGLAWAGRRELAWVHDDQ